MQSCCRSPAPATHLCTAGWAHRPAWPIVFSPSGTFPNHRRFWRKGQPRWNKVGQSFSDKMAGRNALRLWKRRPSHTVEAMACPYPFAIAPPRPHAVHSSCSKESSRREQGWTRKVRTPTAHASFSRNVKRWRGGSCNRDNLQTQIIHEPNSNLALARRRPMIDGAIARI